MLGRSRSQRYEDDDDERDDLNRDHGRTVLEALYLHDRMCAQHIAVAIIAAASCFGWRGAQQIVRTSLGPARTQIDGKRTEHRQARTGTKTAKLGGRRGLACGPLQPLRTDRSPAD